MMHLYMGQMAYVSYERRLVFCIQLASTRFANSPDLAGEFLFARAAGVRSRFFRSIWVFGKASMIMIKWR